MKTLIIILLSTISIMASASDFNFVADAYRGDDIEATERFGFEYGDYAVIGSFNNTDEMLSIEHNKALKFTNVEIGLATAVSFGKGSNLNDVRRVDVVDYVYLEAKPYIKVGSGLFFTMMYDSSNQILVRVGFNFF